MLARLLILFVCKLSLLLMRGKSKSMSGAQIYNIGHKASLCHGMVRAQGFRDKVCFVFTDYCNHLPAFQFHLLSKAVAFGVCCCSDRAQRDHLLE